MSVRPMHFHFHIRPLAWSQVEFGLLAAMCVGGYALAAAFALGGV